MSAIKNPNLEFDKLSGQPIYDKEKYSQVCVWPSTLMELEKIDEFKGFMKENFDADVLFLETVLTLPDFGNIVGTGGRSDLLFAVDFKNTSPKFPLIRLQYGIRWIEDAMSEVNGYYNNKIYPERFEHYKSW